jgi:hypothetical protein
MKRTNANQKMVPLLCVLAAVVIYASPFEPAVEPAMDIEEIWAIEDERQ